MDQTSFEEIVEETTSKVDKLNLHGTENEVVDDWREINTLIKAGDCRRLAAFTELHNIDLQTVRFTVSIEFSLKPMRNPIMKNLCSYFLGAPILALTFGCALRSNGNGSFLTTAGY